MLKTAKPRKGKNRVGGDSRAGHGGSEIDKSRMDDVEVDDDKVEVDEVEKKARKISKSKNSSKSKKTVRSDFFTSGAKLVFTKLRQAFFMAPIFYHFDPERYIRIEMDISGFAIGEILSQLTSNNLGQWHPVAFFSCKMILAEIRYKTHDGELLAIVEAFKTYWHYLEGF